MEWILAIQKYDANYKNISSLIEANQIISQLSTQLMDDLKPTNDELHCLLETMHQTLLTLENEVNPPDSDLYNKYLRLKNHVNIINNLNERIASVLNQSVSS
ncbi:hypothetical protein EXU85_16820 [Spirosoma sp. KCTC 42546]|nr:hypothetical protein EXU85_16820 [Spirosoma sp. KCTC 42546]